MARISRFAHLKPEVRREFARGASVADVRALAEYADVPRTTLQEWLTEFRQNLGQIPAGFRPGHQSLTLQGSSETDPLPLQLLDGGDRRVASEDMAQKTDIQTCRTVLRQIARQGREGDSVRVQACQALLKLISVERGLKVRELEDLERLSDDEALEQLTKILGSAQARQADASS